MVPHAVRMPTRARRAWWRRFDLSSNARLEVQGYLYGAAFLPASGCVLRVDEHVRIDAVAQRFSPRFQPAPWPLWVPVARRAARRVKWRRNSSCVQPP